MRLPDLADLELTYTGVGATRWRATPAGYHAAEHRARLGSGQERFDRAAAALMTWQMHETAGVRIEATGPVAPGVESLGQLRLGPLVVPVPCRVVWTVQDTGRVGFGYGTLPGHPASGEESFVVELDGDDVVLTVRAFSRGARWYSRLGAPVARATQAVFMRRYAGALRRLSAA